MSLKGEQELLAAYLAPRGRAPGIGPERGATVHDGIARFRSPHGSTRYVYYDSGRPLAVLQVVSRDGRSATIANVYVRPEVRRRGLASRLLTQARRDFKKVEHAADGMLSTEGRAWKESARDRSPRRSGRRYIVMAARSQEPGAGSQRDPRLGAERDRPGGGRQYLVYLAKVDGHPRTVYVGSTARGLKLRRRQHRGGGMSHRHCLGKLVPVMRTATREEAERAEARLARALRRKGYTVHGDY